MTIYLSGSVDGVVAFLEENGGDPRNVGEDYVEAYVPVTLLGPVSEQPGVLRVREIVPPERGQGIRDRRARNTSPGPWGDAPGAQGPDAPRPVPGNDARSEKGSRQQDVVGTTIGRIVEMMRPCSDRGIFRFLAMAILAALAVTLAVALPGVSADGGEDKAAPIPRSGGTGGDNQAPPIPE